MAGRQHLEEDDAYDLWRDAHEDQWWHSIGRSASLFNEQQARRFGDTERAGAIVAQRAELDALHGATA